MDFTYLSAMLCMAVGGKIFLVHIISGCTILSPILAQSQYFSNKKDVYFSNWSNRIVNTNN